VSDPKTPTNDGTKDDACVSRAARVDRDRARESCSFQSIRARCRARVDEERRDVVLSACSFVLGIAVAPNAPAWIRHQPIAHRGLHDADRPENSLAAFEAAARSGYPIELDVHRTRDDGVVVFHDETLARMTGAAGRVEDHTVAELAALRLAEGDERIPTLAQALETIAGRVPVVVEIKNDGQVGPLERLALREIRAYRGEVAVQSFNPFSLAWFRDASPELTRGLLASDFTDAELPRYQKFLLRRLLLAPLCAPHYIGYELNALPYWPAGIARRLGIALVAWTIRTPREQERAGSVADNFIFEGVRP
jgi:glycerophosphoryl diester phosphodiesterase